MMPVYARRHVLPKADDRKGQMTVELCVILPIAIAIAAIVVNACTFFGYCSQFDRVSRNAVRVVASMPSRGESGDAIAAAVEQEIEGMFQEANVECDVDVATDAYGKRTYKSVLRYWPTLFGMGLRSEVFGVRLPCLSHASQLTIDPYLPGEVF